jgi:DNA-directed RNA polymerase specialized sigma24 family protein
VAFKTSLATLPSVHLFQSLRRSIGALDRFDDAGILVSYLARDGGDLDEKDRIYAALVRTVQARGPSHRVAYALIWTGLWPGLDGVYRRRLRYFTADPDELCQELSFNFTRIVETMDLRKVHRVAATLVRSTERAAMSRHGRQRSQLANRSDDDPDALPVCRLAAPMSSVGARSFAGPLAEVRARLLPAIGADVDLLLAVLVFDVDQREAAARFGLTHTAARKRFQRALARLRRHVEGAVDANRPPEHSSVPLGLRLRRKGRASSDE